MKNSILVLAVCFIIICAAVTVAQTNRGGISGTVADATGAVIPGAAVTITNLGTNQSFKLTTSEEGTYFATSLEPVVYRIAVETSGEMTAGETVGYTRAPIFKSAPLKTGSTTTASPDAPFRPNAMVAIDVQPERFFHLFLERLAGPA